MWLLIVRTILYYILLDTHENFSCTSLFCDSNSFYVFFIMILLSLKRKIAKNLGVMSFLKIYFTLSEIVYITIRNKKTRFYFIRDSLHNSRSIWENKKKTINNLKIIFFCNIDTFKNLNEACWIKCALWCHNISYF